MPRFNPWIGCSKVSPGCKHCYAETLVTERMGRPGTWGPTGTRERTAPANWRKPICWNALAGEGRLPDRSENPDGHRPRVFCASLADVFEPRPELAPWRLDLFRLIEATPNLDWLLLTKRPEEARDFLERYYDRPSPLGHSTDDPLPNVWVGVSIEDSRYTWRADVLREIPAIVRFISAEPLVGSLFESSAFLLSHPRATVWSGPNDGLELDVRDAKISIASNLPSPTSDQGLAAGAEATEGSPLTARARAPLDLSGIDWVIVGGESGGPKSRPMHPTWAREIRDAVVWGDMIPCGDGCCEPPWPRPALFMKQWGSWSPAGIGDVLNTRLSVGLLENGRQVTVAEAAETPGGELMVYRGPKSTSGGKHFDGCMWCEFPQREMIPA